MKSNFTVTPVKCSYWNVTPAISNPFMAVLFQQSKLLLCSQVVKVGEL